MFPKAKNRIRGLVIIGTLSVLSTPLFLTQSGTAFSQSTGLRLIIQTGQDDLRGNARAIANIRLRNRRNITLPLNNGRGWRNNSKHTVHWSLPRGLSLEQLRGARMTITHSGTPRGFTEQYDTWHMRSLIVSSPQVCRGGEVIAALSGRDIYFSGPPITKILRVHSRFSRNTQSIPYVLVEVKTGSDDLRNGSHAMVTTHLKRGFEWSARSLNKGAKWDKRSTRVARLNFPNPKRISDLKSFKISHRSGRGHFNRDIWRVNRILIKAPQRCSSQTLARVGNVIFNKRRRQISFTLQF